MKELERKIIEVVRKRPLGVLSTVAAGGKPVGRYLMFSIDDHLDVFAITAASSRKVSQILVNPGTHVTIGCDSAAADNPWVGISGRASVMSDEKTRDAFWKDEFKRYFKDKNDPEFCVIRIVPDRVEYWAGWEPEIWLR